MNKPEVIAFVGPSGTGKSHRALDVAFANKCNGIIDDGILIQGTKILAGFSAKNEDNRIQAVKRAIFVTDEHAQEVKAALQRSSIRRLLIIGTSDHMIGKICQRLELDMPIKTVYIQQVATKAEIKHAKFSRLQEGKHIVPVPSVELKPHFTGYFADLPYNLFGKEHKENNERSIVRPNFSFYGKLLIADAVVKDIIMIILSKNTDIYKITDVRVRRRSDNTHGIVILVEVILYYGVEIFEVIKLSQKKIKEKLERMTGMQVKNVNMSVRSLAIRES